jgi:uncharacterized membrane protein
MAGTVFALLLLGALLSATWNALIKGGSNKYLQTVLIANGAALFALCIIPFLQLPDAHSWGYLLISAVLQVIYYKYLAQAFHAGDMSHAYPIMRGTAPLLVSLVNGPLIGDTLSLGKWLGVVLICAGVVGLAWEARYRLSEHRTLIGHSLLSASLIAGYTICDGIGVRASGHAASYAMWNLLVAAIILTIWTVLTRRGEFLDYAKGRLVSALVGGLAAVIAYGIVLWGMTQAPVAAVAALRETSMVFVLAIAVFIFKERVGLRRYAATALITCGAIAIRLW